MKQHKVLDLSNLEAIEPFSARFARLEDLYILFKIDSEQSTRTSANAEAPTNADNITKQPSENFSEPFRLNGMLFILVHKGQIVANINTRRHRIRKGNMIHVQPGTLMQFTQIEKPAEFTVLFISTTFLQNINIDLHTIELGPIILTRPRPLLELTQNETQILRKYLDILESNATNPTQTILSKLVAQTLIASIVYEILRFSQTRISREDAETTVAPGNDPKSQNTDSQLRARNYVFRFLNLLHLNFAKHRDLPYYARQLCITPKYLSSITKQTTGLTAPQWITRIVIQEAKNLLRYSDKNIQEIAYNLNFPSQSAFGKYFKRITGQSPAAYLRNPE